MFRNRKKEILLAITTIILSFIGGTILIDSYFLNSTSNSPFVCEICQFHPQLGWETIPSKTVSNKNVTYTTNSLGMRSKEVDFKKGHVLLVGDSVTFGLGVNNNESVSHHLQSLHEKHQFLNLGVPGYGIGQYFLNLKRHIDKLNPKLIVLIIYTSNDLDETRKETRYGITKPFFIYKEGNLHHLNPKISKYSCSNIYSRSRITKFLIPNILWNQCKSRVIDRNSASQTIAKLISEIRLLGRKRNALTLFVLSPALTAVERVSCVEKNGPDRCKAIDKGFLLLHNYFSRIMKLYNLPHIDFLKIILGQSKNKSFNHLYGKNGKDIHHYSSEGNTLLAKAILENLKITTTGEIEIRN